MGLFNGCPSGWESPQRGWCTDPTTGNGVVAKEARRLNRERNGSWIDNNLDWILATAGGLFGGSVGNQQPTQPLPQEQDDTWIIFAVLGGAILLLLLYLIFIKG